MMVVPGGQNNSLSAKCFPAFTVVQSVPFTPTVTNMGPNTGPNTGPNMVI